MHLEAQRNNLFSYLFWGKMNKFQKLIQRKCAPACLLQNRWHPKQARKGGCGKRETLDAGETCSLPHAWLLPIVRMLAFVQLSSMKPRTADRSALLGPGWDASLPACCVAATRSIWLGPACCTAIQRMLRVRQSPQTRLATLCLLLKHARGRPSLTLSYLSNLILRSKCHW